MHGKPPTLSESKLSTVAANFGLHKNPFQINSTQQNLFRLKMNPIYIYMNRRVSNVFDQHQKVEHCSSTQSKPCGSYKHENTGGEQLQNHKYAE